VERSNPLSNAATPVRIRTTPKLKAVDVQATDEKRVSVKTLSSWMSDDPFEQKKVRHIRSGAKVIAKSRIFEPTQTKSIAINIEAGSVHNKQAWLQEAFRKPDNSNVAKRSLPSSEVRPYQVKKKKESPEKELKSVKEKKEWLSNAFKHNNGEVHKSKSVDHGNSMRRDSTVTQNSASADDDVIMMCSNDMQQSTTPICQAEKRVGNCDNANSRHLDEDEHNTVVSVADRAKWLKGAFNKK